MKTTIPFALGAFAMFLLAGCTPAPPPVDPDECSPEAATISWGSPQERNASLVGAQVLTYTEGGSDVSIETIDREVTPRFSEAALETLAASGAASVDEWKAGLLESARAVKGIRDGFAAPIELSDESYVELTDPTDGVYVTSLASGAVSIDFTVECAGLDEVTGSIRAVSGDELVAVPLLCVPDEEGEGLPAKAAREYCPAA